MSQVIKVKMPMNFNIFLFGDEHVGSKLFFEKGFKKLVKAMNSPCEGLPANRNYGVAHGDCIEAITIDDPRFDLETTKELSMIEQADHYIKLIKPIASKMIVLMDGNHPKKLWRYGKMTEYVCNQAKIRFGTYVCKINYVNNKGKLMFKQYAAHGFGGINSNVPIEKRRIANMQIALKNKLFRKAGDVVLATMGHTHKTLINAPDNCLYLCDDGDDLQCGHTGDLRIPQNTKFVHQDSRWYVNTGTFRRTTIKGLTDYGEMAGYDPIELGYCVALIRGGRLVDVKSVIVS